MTSQTTTTTAATQTQTSVDTVAYLAATHAPADLLDFACEHRAAAIRHLAQAASYGEQIARVAANPPASWTQAKVADEIRSIGESIILRAESARRENRSECNCLAAYHKANVA